VAGSIVGIVARPRDYHHTQIGWVIIASLGFTLLLFAAVMVGVELVAPLVMVLALLGLTVALFATLTVTVDAKAVNWRFGIGLIRGRVPLDEIRYFTPVKNPWYYGWGIHFYPGGTLLNVSGLQAVELWRRNGRRLRIGTDDPRGLVAAIEARIGRQESPSPAETRQSLRAARRVLVLVIGLAVAIVGGLGGLLVLEDRPPRVTVDDRGVKVESFMYGERLRWTEVERVELDDRLPRIRLRTNGYAFGSTLRGHFRLAEWGDGKLFIDHSVPPYVVLFTDSSYVVINFANAAETRRLFAQIGEHAETSDQTTP